MHRFRLTQCAGRLVVGPTSSISKTRQAGKWSNSTVNHDSFSHDQPPSHWKQCFQSPPGRPSHSSLGKKRKCAYHLSYISYISEWLTSRFKPEKIWCDIVAGFSVGWEFSGTGSRFASLRIKWIDVSRTKDFSSISGPVLMDRSMEKTDAKRATQILQFLEVPGNGF